MRRANLVAHAEEADPQLALRSALQIFERELRRLRDRRADRPHAAAGPRLRGVVDRVFLDEGYGFLIGEDGERVYFHRNAVGEGLAFPALREGESVAFSLEAGDKGAQATIVLPPLGGAG